MDHYNHHDTATFEGEYMRFRFPAGASLIIIVCVVHSAEHNPVNVNVTYVPPGHGPIWQRDFWPAELQVQRSGPGRDFVLSAALDAGEGLKGVSGRPEATADTANDDRVTVSLNPEGGHVELHSSNGLHFTADIHSHTPWSRTSSSPEGWFINLPLPLHWHVLSAYSPTTARLLLPTSYTITASREAQAELGSQTPCIAHLEKNWAIGFPTAHVWLQGQRVPEGDAIPHASTLPHQPAQQTQPHLLTVAGGPILGTEAYLVGYRNSTRDISLDFRPPFTLSLVPAFWALLDLLPGFISQAIADRPALTNAIHSLLCPFSRAERDWDARSMLLAFTDPLRGWRLDVRATALRDDGDGPGPAAPRPFYNLAAPYPAGFKDKWMAQCLHATAYVEVRRRRWTLGRAFLPSWTWDLVCEDWFEDVGFEFGGEYYPRRGVGESGTVAGG